MAPAVLNLLGHIEKDLTGREHEGGTFQHDNNDVIPTNQRSVTWPRERKQQVQRGVWIR